MLKAAADADAVVMAAAVADFRPAVYATGKIKKKDGQEPDPVALVRNPDILAEISADRARPGQLVVGFAAETDDVLANGRAKLARKGCDLLVVNEVGEHKAFGSEENEAVVLAADGSETPVPYGPKEALAETVWDLVARATRRDPVPESPRHAVTPHDCRCAPLDPDRSQGDRPTVMPWCPQVTGGPINRDCVPATSAYDR